MSIKGKSQEWYVGKKRTTLISWSGKRLDFEYDDLNRISYFFADGFHVGNVTFIKKTDEKIIFNFGSKSNDAVIRAINLIEEHNPNLILDKIEPAKSSERKPSNSKLCKFCKTESPAAATVCPNCKRRQTGGCLTSFLFIILFLIFFTIFSEILSSDDTTPSNQQTHSNPSSSFSFSEKGYEKETEDLEESNIFNVGDLFESKKVNISYLDTGEYVSENMFVEPASGNKFVYIDLSIQNTGDTDLSIGGSSFTCYADDSKCSQPIVTADDQMEIISTVSSGKYLKGKIYFEVPKNAQSIQVEFETSFWTQDKIYFIIK